YIGHFPLFLAGFFFLYHFAPALIGPQLAPFTALCSLLVTWLALARLGRWVERPRRQREVGERLAPKLQGLAGRFTSPAALVRLLPIPLMLINQPNAHAAPFFRDSTQLRPLPLLEACYGARAVKSANGETNSGMLLGAATE